MLNKEQAIRYGKQVGVRYHIYTRVVLLKSSIVGAFLRKRQAFC